MKFHVDVRDAHVYGGLAVALLGGLTLSWPWALVTIGLIVTALGIFIPRRRGNDDGLD